MHWLLIAGVVLLYSCAHQESMISSPPVNRAPHIDSVVIYGIPSVGIPMEIICYAHDPDGDSLQYFWRATDGNIVGSGPHVQYIAAPCCRGTRITIYVLVRDPHGASASQEIPCTVF